jgi:hypothetical protein
MTPLLQLAVQNISRCGTSQEVKLKERLADLVTMTSVLEVYFSMATLV